MKAFHLAVLSVFVASIVCAQASRDAATPAQQKISWAEAAIKAHPDKSQPYNDLALAYVQRVRETLIPATTSKLKQLCGNRSKLHPRISKARKCGS